MSDDVVSVPAVVQAVVPVPTVWPVRVTVPGAHIRALQFCTANERGTYALNGIFWRAGVMAATDTKRLLEVTIPPEREAVPSHVIGRTVKGEAMMSDAEPEIPAMTMPGPGVLVDVSSLKPKPGDSVTLECAAPDAKSVTATVRGMRKGIPTGAVTSYALPIITDGQFPAYERFVPAIPPSDAIGPARVKWCAWNMGCMLEALALLSPEAKCVTTYQTDPCSPAILTVPGARGIVMPVVREDQPVRELDNRRYTEADLKAAMIEAHKAGHDLCNEQRDKAEAGEVAELAALRTRVETLSAALAATLEPREAADENDAKYERERGADEAFDTLTDQLNTAQHSKEGGDLYARLKNARDAAGPAYGLAWRTWDTILDIVADAATEGTEALDAAKEELKEAEATVEGLHAACDALAPHLERIARTCGSDFVALRACRDLLAVSSANVAV